MRLMVAYLLDIVPTQHAELGPVAAGQFGQIHGLSQLAWMHTRGPNGIYKGISSAGEDDP